MAVASSCNVELFRKGNSRLCHLCLWLNFEGFGFNFEASRQLTDFLRLVESNSIRAAGSLNIRDIVLAVNDRDTSKSDYNAIISLSEIREIAIILLNYWLLNNVIIKY